MASITLTFTGQINVSCQVGDTAYAVDTSTSGGFTVNNGNLVTIGQIREIEFTAGITSVIVDTMLSDASLVTGNFVLFSKDENANLRSILGYYGEAKMVCNSTERAELFSLGTEEIASSK